MSELIENLNALADGELEGDAKLAAQEAVASDPQAAAEHSWAVLFKTQLREKLQPVENDELWAACKTRFDAIDKSQRAEVFVGKYAWAFCLIFLVGIFSAATVNRASGNKPLSNEHVAGLLNGLTPFSFSGPEQALESVRKAVGTGQLQSPDQTRVTSVSLGTVDGRRAAKLTFVDHLGGMSLFVVCATSGIEGIESVDKGYKCGHINDQSAVVWTEYGRMFLLVSNRSQEDLVHAADQIRNVD